MNFNINHMMRVCLMTLALTMFSCLEEEKKEFEIVGAVPTLVLLNASDLPETVEIGASFSIKIRYFSPHVDVVSLSFRERIADSGGSEKSDREISNQAITGFQRSDSYEETFTYQANSPQLATGDVITLTMTATAANGLTSNELKVTTKISPDAQDGN